MKTRILVISLLVVSALGVGAMTQARLDRVSGTLTRTYTIVADTELTGDVTCAVADGTPCFSFTVPGVGLRLNGYTMTGKVTRLPGAAGPRPTERWG